MKKYFLFMSVLAALLMAGCSKEESAPNGGDNGNGEANTSYLAVNLVSSDVTRAATGYRDGETKENKVTNVRFYFFNGSGGAVNVKFLNGGYVNYYDWTPESGDQTNGTNEADDIESKLKATIVITTSQGDGIPQRIAAVLNPPTINGTSFLGNTSMNLSTLKDKVADFATSDLTKEGAFVMFNSVGGGGTTFSTSLIKAENLCKKSDDAINHPVNIYVERSVAKVKVLLGDDVKNAATTNMLALKDKDNKDLKVDGQQVYLKLGGWGLTAETSEGRLVKKINPNWDGWTWYTNYRSFWAINSMSATNRYYDYSDDNFKGVFGSDGALYTNENAQLTDTDNTTGAATKKTKVILKGTLCKSDGTALTIVRRLGSYFIDDANQNKLKESILNQLGTGGYNYYYPTDQGRQQITKDDINIVIAKQEENEDSKNNCYVYAQLTKDAEKKTWYTSLDETVTATVAYTTINTNLANKNIVDWALVWKSGMTYYYYVIKHLDESNENGVVRNHIYETTVTKIAGLGTPVYDPDQVIYPEKPDPNDHYIAARINILSWRLVTNNNELEW